MATEYDGDVSSAIRALLSMRETLEAEVDAIENRNAGDLVRQKEMSEQEFVEGKVVRGLNSSAGAGDRVTLSAGVAEVFGELPPIVIGGRIFEFLSEQPRMFPVRRRGIMKGFRYLVVGYFEDFPDGSEFPVAIFPGGQRWPWHPLE